MKQIEKNELIEGRIYSSKLSWCDSTELFIWKCDKNGKLFYSYRLWSKDKVSGTFGVNNRHGWDNIFEATPEEKHWLETCIKANQFVSYEEAMKTFIPEYVECIEESVYDYGTNVIGKIYKVFGVTPNHINPDYLIEYGGIKYLSVSKHRFKPSTKEAYDAQFVVKEPKVVFEEPKDKILQRIDLLGKGITIVQVQCSEGGVYRIGDKITVFDKTSPNKGKPFIIKSFRWTNDKSKICAVTELHTPNGIGLDKIELYIEPKVKDDFVLPENWYIKVTDDNKEVLQQYIRNIHNLTTITLSNINYVAYSKWLMGINRTENKLGYGLISKLNLNPLPNIYRTVTYYNGVEITFEQFKKYVLKDE